MGLQLLGRPEQDNYEIVTVAMDGSAPERLTWNGVIDHVPVWSPDMTQIAFLAPWSSNAYEWGQLNVISVDGPDDSDWLVRAHSRLSSPPVWSPDSQSLAFIAYYFYGSGDPKRKDILYTVRSDGSDMTRVAEVAGEGVAWSPDGQRLAFARQEGDELALVTVAPDGSDARLITKITVGEKTFLPEVDAGPVSWSPDGDHILYGCEAGVCVVDLDGNPVGQSPEGWIREDEIARAAWSPDGSRIAMRPQDPWKPYGARDRLYTMAPDGTDVQVLVQVARSLVPANSGYDDVPFSIASCAGGFVVPNPEENPGLVTDCETLMGLRDALTGGTIINWTPTTPLEEWEGVVLGGAPSRVTGLEFRVDTEYPLQGVLPPELGRLEKLETLSLYGTPYGYGKRYGNGLTGAIPPELGNLASLEKLSLGNNSLSGSIPPELGNLASLKRLSLGNNSLSGGIPPELGSLASLERLFLSDNSLSGSIPAELGSLASLEWLFLSDNSLSGGIPAELGSLASLERLFLSDNSLSGSIPPELGNLTSLEWLSLSANSLSGGIPPELGKLTNLRVLRLNDNALSGSIPAELGNLTFLEELGVDGNSWSGCIAAELPHLWVQATGLERCRS